MEVFSKEQIKQSIDSLKNFNEIIDSQKVAFIDFYNNLYEVPLPMQFVFSELKSDCHIKGGYKHGSSSLYVKIANSSPLGNNGSIFVFNVNTGQLKTILHDAGFLTTLRTAIAGILLVDYVKWNIKKIGIIGNGNLATQLHSLAVRKYPKTDIMVFARDKAKASSITNSTCDTVDNLLTNCDVIFTATASKSPIINHLPKGVNKMIIALGSDDIYKSEVSPSLYGEADLIITDNKSQAVKFGDIAKAIKNKIINLDSTIEFGKFLKSDIPTNTKTIIADFSGIGAQDVAISEFVLNRLARY
ncbi:MAG: hypothetical protein RLN62_07005 [Rickettsiales bacterium]